jgi:hypothetical protein
MHPGDEGVVHGVVGPMGQDEDGVHGGGAGDAQFHGQPAFVAEGQGDPAFLHVTPFHRTVGGKDREQAFFSFYHRLEMIGFIQQNHQGAQVLQKFRQAAAVGPGDQVFPAAQMDDPAATGRQTRKTPGPEAPATPGFFIGWTGWSLQPACPGQSGPMKLPGNKFLLGAGIFQVIQGA